jgi:hypothetical protein
MEPLHRLLKGKNGGTFKNPEGKYCRVLRYYGKNKEKFEIIFAKNWNETAWRYAIQSTSEKKVVKFLTGEGFILTEE